MNSSKKLRLAVIHQFLPEEIVVLIFKKLDYKSMLQAQGVCKRWNKIITGFGLLNVKNFREYISFIFLRDTFLQILHRFKVVIVYRLGQPK